MIITLPESLGHALTERARRQGVSPEQLALEILREFLGKTASEEESRTLFDFLSGYIGTVEGSGEDVSKNGAQLFVDELVKKKRDGHL